MSNLSKLYYAVMQHVFELYEVFELLMGVVYALVMVIYLCKQKLR